MELDEDGRRAFKIVLRDDGSISNARAERLALMMADEVPRAQAWRVLGGKDKGGSAQYLRKLTTDPVFILRLEALMEERKDLIEKDPIFGESAYNARQLWRMARAEGDNALASKAADMLLKISTAIANRSGGGGPGDDLPGQLPGKVGKPAAPVPENRPISQIKSMLADMPGIPAPGTVPDPAAAAAVDDDEDDGADVDEISAAEADLDRIHAA